MKSEKMKRCARKANTIPVFDLEDAHPLNKMASMSKIASLCLALFCSSSFLRADSEDFKSRILSSADLTITVPDNHTLKVVNFVQDADTTPRATITVALSSGSADVLQASLTDDRMSAEDKSMRVAGAATVTVTHVTGANVFITYRLVKE